MTILDGPGHFKITISSFYLFLNKLIKVKFLSSHKYGFYMPAMTFGAKGGGARHEERGSTRGKRKVTTGLVIQS